MQLEQMRRIVWIEWSKQAQKIQHCEYTKLWNIKGKQSALPR